MAKSKRNVPNRNVKSSRNLTVKQIAKIAVPILKRNGVVKAGIFGSVARRQMKKRSDIDFLIKMKKGKSLLDLAHLKNQLEENLKRDVDLVEYCVIKPKIKYQILSEEVKIL